MKYLFTHPLNPSVVCTIELILETDDSDEEGTLKYQSNGTEAASLLIRSIQEAIEDGYTAFGHIANAYSLSAIDWEYIISEYLQEYKPQLIEGEKLQDWAINIPEGVMT